MHLVAILDLEQERIIREAKDSVATPPNKIDAIIFTDFSGLPGYDYPVTYFRLIPNLHGQSTFEST